MRGILALPLNYYRVHGDNTTSRLFQDGTDFKELCYIYQYLFQHQIWNRHDLLVNKISMYSVIRNFKFDSEKIRENLMKMWEFDILIYEMLHIVYRIKKDLIS